MTRKTETRWGHATEEHPERWTGSFKTSAEVIADGFQTYAPHEAFYVCSGALAWGPKWMPDAKDIETMLWDAAYSEVGEAAEDFPDLSPEALEELSKFLDAWATKHVQATFWISSGTPTRIAPRTQTTLRENPVGHDHQIKDRS